MTPAEVELALDADAKGRVPSSDVSMRDFPGGVEGYAAWWRGLSRAEKVKQAREY